MTPTDVCHTRHTPEPTTTLRVSARFATELRQLCGALGVNMGEELERRMAPILPQMREEAIRALGDPR